MTSPSFLDLKRVLVIVAHPDDAEFGCSGTVALFTAAGTEVGYVICTDGAAGSANPELDISQLGQIRQAEQREACEVLGVSSVAFLEHRDGELIADLGLRRELTREIRRHRPDLVICQNAVRTYSNVYGNHPDHLAAGQSAIEAVYPAARNPYAFPDLLQAGLEPHTVGEVWITGTESPDHFVDVTQAMDLKLEALSRHRSQHAPGSDFKDRVRQRMADQGKPQGFEYAESFRRLTSR